MAIYVDDMQRQASVGGRAARWSHLIADTSEELFTFARTLGLSRSWVQKPGTFREHFDVTEGMRAKAIAYGAIPISYFDLPQVTRRIRDQRRAESA